MKIIRNLWALTIRALATLSCLALLTTSSFAESWSKVIGLSNEMESWMSSNGSANDCLSLDKEVTLYGGFVNSCPFKVQYVFCAYRPNKGSWTESFDCEKGKGGYDIIGAKSRQAAHTRNAESTHWAACPWSDMDGKFLDISIDAKWDGQRKQYEARCVLKNPDKKDKADKKTEPKDEEPVALVRRGGNAGTDMFKQAITKAEQAEREEKERIARLERERVERERLEREARERERIEREKRERDLARRNVDDNRTQPQLQSNSVSQAAGSQACTMIVEKAKQAGERANQASGGTHYAKQIEAETTIWERQYAACNRENFKLFEESGLRNIRSNERSRDSFKPDGYQHRAVYEWVVLRQDMAVCLERAEIEKCRSKLSDTRQISSSTGQWQCNDERKTKYKITITPTELRIPYLITSSGFEDSLKKQPDGTYLYQDRGGDEAYKAIIRFKNKDSLNMAFTNLKGVVNLTYDCSRMRP